MGLITAVSYVTVFSGFTLAYPVFGQYTPEMSNYTEFSNFTEKCENPIYDTTVMNRRRFLGRTLFCTTILRIW
mgnify:CR=1 FL=1